jgi:membrane protease YdiL (CAAX protease family)
MSGSLILVFVWIVAANFIAMIPSKKNHWPAAYVLIALGIPLLGWVVVQNGPWIGLLCLAAGVSILRWPVRYLGRWIGCKASGEKPVGPAE